jgi:DUF4097 and DUF4098 domain-containing protein YvlB
MSGRCLNAAFATALLLAATTASAAPQTKVFTQTIPHRGPMDPRGAIYIENAVGGVEVTGTDQNVLEILTVRVIRGVDAAAVEEGKRMTQIGLQGHPRAYFLRTNMRPSRDGRWSATVSYKVKVPRSVEVTISSHSGEGITVSNMSAGLVVKNVNGPIRLNSVLSPMRVESINGTITAVFPYRPSVDVLLSTINGDVDVIVPATAGFLWTAETLKGDFVSTMPLRGSTTRGGSGTAYRVAVNGHNVPNVRTISVTGRVALLTSERERNRARSLIASGSAPPPSPAAPPTNAGARMIERVSAGLLLKPPTARTFVAQQSVIDGDFRFETSFGNVFLGEVRGTAHITTRAGEINIGRVASSCEVTSYGGPINLGDIAGELQARTSAGDIGIRAARNGGVVNTEGGSVQILFSGGPIDIRSGGGDITLRHAGSRVRAQTKQGDIEITVDPKAKTQRVEASTVGGSIVLNVAPGFGGDFDITVLTDDTRGDKIHSSLQGLAVERDTFAGKTRVRARGKVNGGGERVQLFVDEGDIHIRTGAAPVIMMQQR